MNRYQWNYTVPAYNLMMCMKEENPSWLNSSSLFDLTWCMISGLLSVFCMFNCLWEKLQKDFKPHFIYLPDFTSYLNYLNSYFLVELSEVVVSQGDQVSNLRNQLYVPESVTLQMMTTSQTVRTIIKRPRNLTQNDQLLWKLGKLVILLNS